MPALRGCPVKELLTQKDLAEAMGVRTGTIRQWRLRGKVPEPAERLGQYPAWTRAQVEEWLNRGYPVDGRSTRYKKKATPPPV